jgi:CRP-like cAMP-binding protein
MDYALLASSPLFRGISQDEIKSLLHCLKPTQRKAEKGAMLYRVGDQVHELGLVLSGSVSLESDDLWGNRTILDQVGPGRVFAETYACVPGEALMVNVVALEDTEVLFLDVGSLLQMCSSACGYHTKLIQNLLAIAAQKNLNLSRRSFHIALKSIRARVLSYLSFQAMQQGTRDFHIPYNRQQLADYLNVDRSALSAELSKMQKDGLLTVEKNHFVVSEQVKPEL